MIVVSREELLKEEIDIKLDLVPPYQINFMSRQLLSNNGFQLFKQTRFGG